LVRAGSAGRSPLTSMASEDWLRRCLGCHLPTSIVKYYQLLQLSNIVLPSAPFRRPLLLYFRTPDLYYLACQLSRSEPRQQRQKRTLPTLKLDLHCHGSWSATMKECETRDWNWIWKGIKAPWSQHHQRVREPNIKQSRIES